MKLSYINTRNAILGGLYRNILKRIFFLNDPELVHNRMVRIGHKLGKSSFGKVTTKWLFNYQSPMLKQDVLGIHFKNPIGLAAGFDKDAQLVDIMPSVGFGFEEIGSITGESCEGNPKPRLWRLKKSKSLVVYYGLKNLGADAISRKLKEKEFRFPVGISIAKTNSQETCDTTKGVSDYLKTYKAFEAIGHYYTLNISCPNTFGGQPFTDPTKLEKLLAAIDGQSYTKPIFIKLSPDLSTQDVDDILNVIENHKIAGLIISNLTKNRVNQKIKDDNIPEHGGLSGKVVEDLSNDLIKYVYAKTQGKYVIIGCGGVFSAQDAYKKIKLGATLIQMVTGMIFEGPQIISEINSGLVDLLKNDGYKNISEAVGKAHVNQ
jgi:dihydroorotate dehydrogenase